MAKSPDAFRTISEVADWLGVQAHVLRFWESKFAQVKPIKRAGGRRYYRPADMLLLGGIKQLLHEDGMTIKGAQKLLREKGVAHVADLSQPLDDLTMAVIEGDASEIAQEPRQAADEAPGNAAFEQATPLEPSEAEAEHIEAVEEAVETEPEEVFSPDSNAAVDDISDGEPVPTPQFDFTPSVEETQDALPEPEDEFASDVVEVEPSLDTSNSPTDDAPWLETGVGQIQPENKNAPEEQQVNNPDKDTEEVSTAEPISQAVDATEETPEVTESAAAQETENTVPTMPSFRARHRAQPHETTAGEEIEQQEVTSTDDASAEVTSQVSVDSPAPQEDTAEQAPLAPHQIDIPRVPPHSEIKVEPSLLSALAKVRHISPNLAREFKPHVARLTRLRASMANARKDSHKD